MLNLIQRTKGLEKNIQKVVRRKSSYLIFYVPDILKGDLEEICEGGPIDGDLKTGMEMPPIESSKEKFNECIEKIAKHNACYVLYDFYFERENGDMRNILILICYLNEQNCAIREKFFYSSNALQIKEEVSAAELISIHSLEDLKYDKIQNECRKIKKN